MYYVPLVLWNSITSLPRLYALACLWRGKEFLYPEKKNKHHECDISKSTIHARESQKKTHLLLLTSHTNTHRTPQGHLFGTSSSALQMPLHYIR